jgi:ATP-binding cassette subfamily E protein 1
MDRVAIVDKKLCPQEKNKLRNFVSQLAKVCPINRSGKKCISEGEKGFPLIDESLCLGCGLCVKTAKNLGYDAITIVNLPHMLKEKPIHRFGKNGFILFRLPFPSKGEIVGVVGRNATGKTTAIRILSGEIKPNLGEEKETDFKEIVKIFRGTELQAYLTELGKQKIVTSVKPQRVDKIPIFYKGKVGELLRKIDERNILERVVKDLGIEKIFNLGLDEISGGELQRVAIAACLVKNADFYYFDEPTSFLDVFQRLNVAKAIRKYCENKAVIVVDHDLATLDFLADKIHIFYGFPGAYGIVSKPYGVRTGINTFLEGYIREDNVRIRKEPIRFFTSFIEKKVSEEVLISFKNIKKSFKVFKLEVKFGEIRKKEVLVALGANALGKTTFARILAGEIKKDEGEISGKIKVSYKPQYIRVNFEGKVKKFLAELVKNKDLRTEILIPLELERVLKKNIQDLSGGELQRVIIASALAKDADLYLLDEPSAFLDVEQRLALAKLIRKFVEKREKSAFVIDHDLLFLSKIGDRAMVFLGEPGKFGEVSGINSMKDAFNIFLKEVGITFRKDPQTGRPRANKPNSKLDVKQKERGEYFCI